MTPKKITTNKFINKMPENCRHSNFKFVFSYLKRKRNKHRQNYTKKTQKNYNKETIFSSIASATLDNLWLF